MIQRFFSSQTARLEPQASQIGATIFTSKRGISGYKTAAKVQKFNVEREKKTVTYMDTYTAALRIAEFRIELNELLEYKPFVKTVDQAKADALRAEILTSKARFEAEKVAKPPNLKGKKENAAETKREVKMIAEKIATLFRAVEQMEASVKSLQNNVARLSRKNKVA